MRTLVVDVAPAVIDVSSSEDHTRPQLLKVVSAVAQNGASGPQGLEASSRRAVSTIINRALVFIAFNVSFDLCCLLREQLACTERLVKQQDADNLDRLTDHRESQQARYNKSSTGQGRLRHSEKFPPVCYTMNTGRSLRGASRPRTPRRWEELSNVNGKGLVTQRFWIVTN